MLRRDFLKTVGAAGLVPLVTVPALRERAQPVTEKIEDHTLVVPVMRMDEHGFLMYDKFQMQDLETSGYTVGFDKKNKQVLLMKLGKLSG